MKGKNLIILIFILFGILSCSVNIYESIFVVDYTNTRDVKTLLGLAKKYLSTNDYTNAYKTYAKILGYNETNYGKIPDKYNPLSNSSEALLGISYAYLSMNYKLNYSNFINIFLNQNFIQTNLFYLLNDIYSVSEFITKNLYRIIYGLSDNYIISNDANVNLIFFVFNTFYSVFNLIDCDTNNNSDGDVQEDTEDWIYITKNFEISNHIESFLDNITNKLYSNIKDIDFSSTNFNSIIKMLNLIKDLSNDITTFNNFIKQRIIIFTNHFEYSYYSIGNIMNNIKNNDIKTNFLNMKENIIDNFYKEIIKVLYIFDSINAIFNKEIEIVNLGNINNIYAQNLTISSNIISEIKKQIENNSIITNIIYSPHNITNILFSGNSNYTITSNMTLEERQQVYSNFINDINSQGISNISEIDSFYENIVYIYNIGEENTNTNNVSLIEIISNYFFNTNY